MAITPKTYPNILKYGLQASYDGLASKDANVLYFCTDTKKIYKGAVDFTDSVVYSTKAADVTAPIVGKLYVFSATGTCEVYTGTEWKVVSYPITTTIDAASDDVHVPSAKAVYDFVQDEISSAMTGTDVVKSIKSTDGVEGSITYTTGDGVDHNVALKGVVTTPSYDASTRKFTFHTVGSDDLVVELGKDIFVDPLGDNSYHADTKEIWLTLNNGTEGTAATVIKIPAAGLVNILTGETGITLNYSFDTYGPKEVACVMVYKNLSDENKVYNLTVKDTFTIAP